MNDLFGQPIVETKPAHHHGHPARPGTGPAGETCGTCEHYTHKLIRSGRKFRKCGLTEASWTGGPGTDIRKKDAACAVWKGKA